MKICKFWSFLILLLAQSNCFFAQESATLDACLSPRIQEANTIEFTNLEAFQTYKIAFPHNPSTLNIASLFEQTSVKNLTHSNRIIYFTPLKQNIKFYYPGIDPSLTVVNCNEFYINKLEGSMLKSMMGITTEKGAQPSYLVTNVLLGDFCLDVSNINLTNNSNTYGTFSNGSSSIGIEDGIILATGNISAAEGPNTGNYSAAGGSNSPDSDIAQITSGSQHNVVKLEFDFVPDENTIQFEYVFASEEYCFYVNSSFNDAFGFFLSGPGIAGTYTNNAINMATLPNGTPVSINNVNWGLNSEAYVTNSIGGGGGCTAGEISANKPFLQLTGFNGFTTPLIAQADVIPCETYHIKIVIADIGDGLLDSGVFLGSTSFVSGEADSRVNITAGSINDTDNIAEEGCENAYIAFEKDPPENEVTFSFEVLPTGTATEGVDYESFPVSYTIPAGVSVDTLWIDIFGDLFTEGLENVEVRIVGLCDCLDPIVEFLIEDPPTYTREYSICEGSFYDGPNGPIYNEGEFFELVENDDGCDSLFLTYLTLRPKTYYDTTIYRCFGEPLEFKGETLDFAPALDVFILDDENYVSCDSIIQLNFQWVDPVLIPAVDDTLNCANETVQLYTTNGNIPDNISYFWVDPDGNTILEESPEVSIPGIYQLISTLEIEDQLCDNYFPYEIEVFADTISPMLQPIEDEVIYCNLNSPVIFSTVSNLEDIPDIEYSWSGPNGFTSSIDSIMPTDSGTYILEVYSPSTGCLESTEFNITYEDVIPEIQFSTTAIGCNAINVPIINSVDIEGGTYMWTGPNGFTSDDQFPMISETGTYTLTYSLSSTCTNSESIEITTDDALPEFEALGDTIICNQGDGQLEFSAEDIASFYWEGPSGFYSESSNPIVNIEGDYTVQVIGNNGCVDSSTVSLNYIDIIPDLAIFNDTITCTEPAANLIALSSFTELSYTWQGPSGFSSLDESPETALAGIYYITITNQEGCTNENQVEIFIDTISPSASFVPEILNCANTSRVLQAISNNSNDHYTWKGPANFSSNSDTLETSIPGEYTLISMANNGCVDSFTATIDIDTITPIFNVFGDTLDCNSSLANISAEFSNSNYSIAWTDINNVEISSSNTVEVNIAGQYTAFVQNDQNGCVSVKKVEVIENENTPDLSLIADTITCENKSFFIESISSHSDLQYNWSGPNSFSSNSQDIEILESGIYELEVISDIGCIVNRNIVVEANTDAPVISLIPDTLNCIETSIYLGITSSEENATYFWNGPNSFESDDESPLVSAGGIYYVTVTGENHCTSEEFINIEEDNITPEISLTNSDVLDCNQTSVFLFLEENVSLSSDYLWSGPAGFSANTQNVEVSEEGIYTVTVTPSNGCVVIETIEVTSDYDLIEIIANDQLITCNNPTVIADVIFDNTNVETVEWLYEGQPFSNEFYPEFSIGGSYIINITGVNGCINSDSIFIQENFLEPAFQLSGGTLSCENPEIEITTNTTNVNYSYSWNYNDTDIQQSTPSIQIQDAGTYQVTIQDLNNGCENEKSIEIIELPDIESFEFLSEDPNCFDPTGNISFGNIVGGTPPFLYSIDGGNTYQESPNFENLDAGTYQLEILDDFSCFDTEQTDIISLEDYLLESEPLYIIFLGESKKLQVTTSIDPNDIDTIIWSPSIDLSCTNCLDPVVETLTGGFYTVKVIDVNGCEITTEIEIRVLENPYFIPNVFTPDGDGKNDFFSIFGKLENISLVNEFRIYDRWGENVFTAIDALPTSEDIKWFGSFKGEPAQSGVYAYYIKYTLINGESYERKGDVTIMR